MNYRRIFPIAAGALLVLVASYTPTAAEANGCNQKWCIEHDPPFVDVCLTMGLPPWNHCEFVDEYEETCEHNPCKPS